MKYTLLSFAMIAALFGCKKEEEPAPASTTTPPTTTASPYYIEGNVDGVYVKADQLPTGQQDSTYCYFDMSTPLVSMTKYVNFSINNLQCWSLSFYYDLDALTIPTTYDGAVDNIVLSYSPPGSMTYPYDNDFGYPSALTVNSKTGDVVEGTFYGTFVSPTDTVVVTNGKFKVKVVRK